MTVQWRLIRDVTVYTTDGGEAHLDTGTIVEVDDLEYQVDPDWVAIKVADTGGGVPNDALEEVEPIDSALAQEIGDELGIQTDVVVAVLELAREWSR